MSAFATIGKPTFCSIKSDLVNIINKAVAYEQGTITVDLAVVVMEKGRQAEELPGKGQGSNCGLAPTHGKLGKANPERQRSSAVARISSRMPPESQGWSASSARHGPLPESLGSYRLRWSFTTAD